MRLFHVWPPQIKSAVYRRRPQTLEELRNFITAEWEAISQRSINAAIDRFLPRVQAVVYNEGGHIGRLNFRFVTICDFFCDKMFVEVSHSSHLVRKSTPVNVNTRFSSMPLANRRDFRNGEPIVFKCGSLV